MPPTFQACQEMDCALLTRSLVSWVIRNPKLVVTQGRASLSNHAIVVPKSLHSAILTMTMPKLPLVKHPVRDLFLIESLCLLLSLTLAPKSLKALKSLWHQREVTWTPITQLMVSEIPSTNLSCLTLSEIIINNLLPPNTPSETDLWTRNRHTWTTSLTVSLRCVILLLKLSHPTTTVKVQVCARLSLTRSTLIMVTILRPAKLLT